MGQDLVADLLRKQPLSDAQRADLWDVYHASGDLDALTSSLQSLQVPAQAKAALWDLKAGSAPAPIASHEPATPEHPHARIGRLATEALPTIGGVLGGIAGAPAGIGGMAGMAALGGAAGRFGQRAIEAVQGQPTPQGNELLSDAAAQGAMQGASELVGGGVAKAAGVVGKGVYRGILKPSLSERLAPRANQIVETAVEESLPISRSGVRTGQRVIGELNREVDRILATSRGQVDIKQVGDRVRAFAKRRYFKPGTDLADYRAALNVADNIDQHPALGLPEGMTPTSIRVSPSQANEIKRALDVSAGEAAFGAKTGAEKSTEKFARRDLRGQLERVAPAIAPLNARESRLIDATKTIARAVEREANQNQIAGVKSLVSGMAAGGAVVSGQDPASAAGYALALRAGLHPAVASRAALTAVRAQRQFGITAAAAARLAVFALSQDADQPQDEPE